MKKSLLLLFVILLTLFFSVNSNATTLTFEGLGLSNYDEIPQSYGDILGLDVSYAVKEGFGETDYIENETVNYWQDGYSDLTDVAWAGSNNPLEVAEITFAPSAGNSATITGFDLGFWRGNTYSTQARIYNQDYSEILFDTGLNNWGGSGHLYIGTNITRNATLHLQWLYPFYVAIDNVEYDVSFSNEGGQPNPANPVPEPTTIVLSGLGILGMGVLLRRKKFPNSSL